MDRTPFLLLLTMGSGVAIAGEGPPSAWVLVDLEAREAGILVEISGQPIDATLPVEVAQDQELAIQTGQRLRRAWLEGNLLYLVQGRRGKLRVTRPGIDVSLDTVAIRTDEETAQTLGEELGLEVEWDRGRWLLHGEQILLELAYAPIPAAELDVEPVPVGSSDATRVKRRFATARTEEKRTHRRGRRRNRIDVPNREQAPVANAPEFASWSLPLKDHPSADPTERTTPPELTGWYCTEVECVVLGVDGLAHYCRETGCTEAGAWALAERGIQVGGRSYVWSNGELVSSKKEPTHGER